MPTRITSYNVCYTKLLREGLVERVLVDPPGREEFPVREGKGLGLDIEGPDCTGSTHQSGQKKRVAAPAAGGVDHPIAGSHRPLEKEARKPDRTTESLP